MTKLDSILKSRDITLPTKVHLVKVMVFPVVMYGCESWTVKTAECLSKELMLLTHESWTRGSARAVLSAPSARGGCSRSSGFGCGSAPSRAPLRTGSPQLPPSVGEKRQPPSFPPAPAASSGVTMETGHTQAGPPP